MRMEETIVFLCIVAVAWAAPVSQNEQGNIRDNQDTPNADHDLNGEENLKGFFTNQEYSSGNISYVNGRNISLGHVEYEDNIYYRIQTELSENGQNDKEYDVREQSNIIYKTGEGYRGSIGNQDNHIQSLSDTNGRGYATHGLEDNAVNISMRREVYDESIHWPEINEGGNANGGDRYNEGSSDGWGEATDLGEYEHESHHNGNNTQACVDGTENHVGAGDRDNVDDSLNTGEEEGFQGRGDVSPEKNHVKLCLEKKRSDVLVSNGNMKDTVSNNTAENHGNANSDNMNNNGRNMLSNVTTSQDIFWTLHKDDVEDSIDHKDINENESTSVYHFNYEFMQGHQPGESQDTEGSEKSSQLDLSSQASGREESGNVFWGEGEEQKTKDHSEQLESKVEDSDSQLESSEHQSQSVRDDSVNDGTSVSIKDHSHPESNQTQSESISETDSESRSSSESESESESESSSESESKSIGDSESESSSESESESEHESSSESEYESESKSESESESSSESESRSSSESESERSSESESESESESSNEGESKSSSESGSESSSESESESSNESESESSSESESKSKRSSESESKSSSESESESESSNESESKSSSESKSESESSESESESESSSESDSSSSEDN